MLKEKPEETGIERYLITNSMGETIYAYWKIVYEEITEEFLYGTYDIKNVQLTKKGRQSRKVSIDSDKSEEFAVDSSPKILKHSGELELPSTSQRKWSKQSGENNEKNEASTRKPASGLALTSMSFTPASVNAGLSNFVDQLGQKLPRKYSKKTLCLDEMDIAGSVFKKATQKARKKSHNYSHKEGKESILLKHSMFVPIAVCIKTANPYSEQAEQVLDSLIALLYNNEGSYMTELHNSIYSFAEFCSHILSLTQITSPPPFTELVIPLINREVTYYEGLIGNIPCEGDFSFAQLFSLVETDYIITLWTALLLEKDIIIYTSSANLYFFIVKPLTQLLFPLCWQFTKGIIPNLDLLSSPTPYCFGKADMLIFRSAEIVV